MATYHVTRRLPYTPEQVFTLVGDVEAYPQFIPWITAMQAQPAHEVGEGVTVLEAEASVGFSFLKEAFTTRVTRDVNQMQITVSLISGPFRRLENVWAFKPHRIGCEVVFDIDFQFKGRLLDMVLKANFGYAVDRLIGCFETRARKLYGAPTLSGAGPKEALAPS